MTETAQQIVTKSEQAATHVQTILTDYWKSNAENSRLRAEVESLRAKLREADFAQHDVFQKPLNEADCVDAAKGGAVGSLDHTHS